VISVFSNLKKEHFKKTLDLPSENQVISPRSIVIINQGHGVSDSEYSFLTHFLIIKGYFVISIDHDWMHKSTIIDASSLHGKQQILGRGVKKILFVLNFLKRQPLNFVNITLIGHASGGDIVMLFAKMYQNLIQNVISLDSFHMPLPRTICPKVLYLKANNTKTDDKVLPTPSEQKELGLQIINLEAKQINFCDRGSEKIKQKINNLILKFLNNL
jgi:hypothetical protein